MSQGPFAVAANAPEGRRMTSPRKSSFRRNRSPHTGSRVQSRAATPLSPHRIIPPSRALGSEPSRSHSRARPGRGLPDVLKDKDRHLSETPLPKDRLSSYVDRDTRETRFASPFRPPSEREDALSILSLTAKARESRFSPDERGEEMDDNARVWRIYMDEASKADSAMTDGWNRSLDVLLVFTGLFSAVLTTFIIQSYQMIIPDPGDTTNVLLAQLIALQVNSSGAAALSQLSAATGSSQPARTQAHWVNGLWFAALSCSLSSALVSMMAKQWLQAYSPNVSGTPQQQSRLRQSRSMQLQAWYVPAVINALPVCLHLALLLFFAGLIVLLWSADIEVTFVTLAIVACAYVFYSASIWLPLVYPDCPYTHPITVHIQRSLIRQSVWATFKSSSWRARFEARIVDEEGNVQPEDLEVLDGVGDRIVRRPSVITRDDLLDAQALCWLFTSFSDKHVVEAALQALAGLPRNFTALQVLRDADALHLVEQGFLSCFHKDTTVDLQWHLTDVVGAELYCRAWMALTRGTAEQWPIAILEPLWILQEADEYPDASAFASCAVALSSFDSMKSQWDLLAYLQNCTSGDVQLSQATQCWLLDSISECITRWEMPKAIIEETTSKAVPILLRLLRLTRHSPTTNRVRSATALALYLFVCGPTDLSNYLTDEMRRAAYCELTLQALSGVVQTPRRYGVHETEILDLVAQELCGLSSHVVGQSERFPHSLRSIARSSLSKLFIERRVAVGAVAEPVLANVLQLLFPPTDVSTSQRPALVTVLLESIEKSGHPDIISWGVRLLELLLTRCDTNVSRAFVDNGGIAVVLRTARAGDVDSRRLQIDSIRALCSFIDSSATILTRLQGTAVEELPLVDSHLDLIFESDFFETLCAVVASRKWWLFEVSGHWMPALVRLCNIRPDEEVWSTVVRTFQEFADRNVNEDGYSATLRQLRTMRHACGDEGSSDSDVIDDRE